LLPSGRGRYQLLDPADGSRQSVDASVATTLEPVAYSFYRSFGEKRGAWDLLRFGLQGYSRDIRMLALCGIAVTLFGMVTPQATAVLFAHAIPDADRGLLFQTALGMVAAVLGSVLFDLTRAVSAMRVQSGMGIALVAGSWDWLLKLSPAFFRKFSAGVLRDRVEGFSRIQEQLRPETQRALSVGLTAVLYLGLMLYYSVPLGLLAAICGLTIMSATALCCASLRRLQDSLQQMEGSPAEVRERRQRRTRSPDALGVLGVAEAGQRLPLRRAPATLSNRPRWSMRRTSACCSRISRTTTAARISWGWPRK
jgi:ATP-binding cassette subfamily C protein